MLGIFRNRRLKKDASNVQTGLLPLGDIRSAVVVVDGAADKVNECVAQVEKFCEENKIALRLMYIDLRKYNSKTLPPTESGRTLLKKDLNWFGQPNPLRAAQILSSPADLYICLYVGEEYCVKYISSTVQAKFKVGPCEYRNDPFNMVVSPVGSSDAGSSQGSSADSEVGSGVGSVSGSGFGSGSASASASASGSASGSASVDVEALFLKIRDLLVSVR